MIKLLVKKLPLPTEVWEVTKAEIEQYRDMYPSISMGNHDKNYLSRFKDTDVVGVIAGDLTNIDKVNADLWFINLKFFRENYEILEDLND